MSKGDVCMLKFAKLGIVFAMSFSMFLGTGTISAQAEELNMDQPSISGNDVGNKNGDSDTGDKENPDSNDSEGNDESEPVVLHATLINMETECSVDPSYADSYNFVSHNYYHILGFKDDPSECTEGYYPVLHHMTFYNKGEEVSVTGEHTLYVTIPEGVTLIQVTSDGEREFVGDNSKVAISVTPDAYRFCLQGIPSLVPPNKSSVRQEVSNTETGNQSNAGETSVLSSETSSNDTLVKEDSKALSKSDLFTKGEIVLVDSLAFGDDYASYLKAIEREGITNPLFVKQKARSDSYKERAYLALCLWVKDRAKGGTATIGAYMNNPKYMNYEKIDELRQNALKSKVSPEKYLGIENYMQNKK